MQDAWSYIIVPFILITPSDVIKWFILFQVLLAAAVCNKTGKGLCNNLRNIKQVILLNKL